MRLTLSLILLLSCLVGATAIGISSESRPKVVGDFSNFIENSVLDPLVNASFERSISFSGLFRVKEGELLQLLPTEASNFTWNLFPERVLSSTRTLPWIKEINLTRCHWYSTGCFEIQVDEFAPRFVVDVSGQQWIVSREGVFVTPAQGEKGGEDLPVVSGVELRSGSFDLMRSRMGHVAEVLEVFETASGEPVRELTIGENGEFTVALRRLDLTVVVGQSYSKSTEEIRAQASRLKLLLARLGEGSDALAKVDLGFSRVGVATLKADASLVDGSASGG
ncbi:MAG: hypothetical protein KDD64_10110 [Bdellovibrionales bacterium]|nr:hypothetical protein [Bdellovibrionales bacterium]